MSVIVKSRDSLFTTSSGYTNYRGILNLVIILLVLSNARAALENIIKYGILVDPLSWFLFFGEGSKHWPALLIVLSQSGHILASLLLEKLMAHLHRESKQLLDNNNNNSTQSSSSSTSSHKVGAKVKRSKGGEDQTRRLASISSAFLLANAAIVANLVACIALPPWTIYTNDTHPISTSGSLMLVSIVFLKLVSYHMMNFWCRDLQRAEPIQSRTTKSFLKLYTPPVVDFKQQVEAANNNTSKLVSDASSRTTANNLHKQASPPEANNTLNASSSLDDDDDDEQQVAGCSTRRRRAGAGGGDDPTASPKRNGISNSINNNNNNSSNSNHPSAANADASTAKNCEKTTAETARETAALLTLARYPENVGLRDLCAYMVYPTLCYELEYARTQRIRKRFLIKRIVELIILSQLDMALIQQWIVPTVSNSVLPFRQMQFSHMLERLLKLAIPNHVIWLIWFYLFFHSLLNIVAELTRFADREFYRDWWNSESVYYFWSNWNIPVHKWCARHLYIPLMALGLNKCQASTAVFFVSAFFHEYLVSVPLKMFRMWAFTGMLIQLPWARFVSAYFNHQFANVAVWVSLIIGQPLCILMYYHDYYVIHNAPQPGAGPATAGPPPLPAISKAMP